MTVGQTGGSGRGGQGGANKQFVSTSVCMGRFGVDSDLLGEGSQGESKTGASFPCYRVSGWF